MIANSLIIEIERMIAEKRSSQREIAEKTGISVTMVNRIATGKRKIHRSSRAELQNDLDQCRKPCPRCKGCGWRVQMPCLRCAIENGTADYREPFSESHELAGEARMYTPTPEELTKFYEEQRNLREAVYANAKYEPTEDEEEFDD